MKREFFKLPHFHLLSTLRTASKFVFFLQHLYDSLLNSNGVLVAQRFLGRPTFDQAVVGLIPGRGVIKAFRSTQPSIPLGR